MSDRPTLTPATAIPRGAARACQVTAATFLVALAVLHIAKPELEPSWRFISEYAIGTDGWMMTLAFLALAASYVALFTAIRSQARTIGGCIVLGLLVVSAAGLTIAGVFATDPITTPKDDLTNHGAAPQHRRHARPSHAAGRCVPHRTAGPQPSVVQGPPAADLGRR